MGKETWSNNRNPLTEIEGPRNLTEHVYMRIEKAITEFRIKPGEEIQEVGLAKQLGTSVTPVREALNRLVGDGLIIREPNKHPRVVKFSEKEIEDLYDIRSVLESLGVFLAASHITPDDIARLRKIQERGKKCHISGDMEGHGVYNAEFHEAILDLSQNSLLIEMMAKIRKKNMLCMSSTMMIPGMIEQALKEHAEIIGLLEKRDTAKVQKAMRRHIELRKKAFLEQLS